MYPLPDDGSPEPPRVLTNIPSTSPIEVVVRIYVIRVREDPIPFQTSRDLCDLTLIASVGILTTAKDNLGAEEPL